MAYRFLSNTSTGKKQHAIFYIYNCHTHQMKLIKIIAEHLLCPRLGAPERRWWRSSASSPQDLAPALERAHRKYRTNGQELDCSSTSSGRVAEGSPEADGASRKTGRSRRIRKNWHCVYCFNLMLWIFFSPALSASA